MSQADGSGRANGLNEEILSLVSRGKPKSREVTAHDLFGSSSSEEEAVDVPQRRDGEEGEANAEEEEEVIPRRARRKLPRPADAGEADGHSDGYDHELYGDAEDRQRLKAMTEIDREAVLYERAQARLARAERKALERKVRDMERLEQEQQKAQRAPPSKRQGLDALRAARDRKRRRADGANDDSDYRGSGPEDEEEGQLDGGESAYSEEDVPVRRAAKGSKPGPVQDPIDLETANRMRLSRNTIVQWIYHPDFDELARGALVRLSLGPDGAGQDTYRLVEVKKIMPYYRTYKVGATTVSKGALLKYGKSERTFRLDVVSNGEFTEKEYGRWRLTMQHEGVAPVSRKVGQSKADAWASFLASPVSDDVVQAMVAAKKEAGNAHRNLVAERTQLLAQRAEAQAEGNTEEVQQIDMELATLTRDLEESQAKRQGSSRLEALAELNRRNRQLNVSIAREAEKISASQREAALAGGTRMDPFSRRRTQPTSFHDFDESGSSAEAPAAEQPVAASQPASSQKPINLFDVHDVDIDIDI